MYKLYGSAGSRILRPMWLLEEMDVECEMIHAKPHSPEVLKLSPIGKVPVLVDGNITVTDSAAICSWLADAHPGKKMSPQAGTRARGAYDSWMFFLQTELEGPCWLKTKHKFMLPEELRLDVNDYATYEFARAVEAAEAMLGDNVFALGEDFTAVDVLFAHTLQWARSAKFALPGRIAAYLERTRARPALERARAREKAAEAA